MFGGNAGSAVHYARLDSLVASAALHGYETARRREPEGVVEQGGQDLAGPLWVTARRELARVVDLEPLSFGARSGREALGGFGEDARQIEGLSGDGELLGIQARQEEQVGEHRVHPVGLAEEVLHKL